MKKLMSGVLITIVALAAFSLSAAAAPKEDKSPFAGEFSGIVHGDNGSETTLVLELDQAENVVVGNAFLGEGLVVDAGGFCGVAVLPAAALAAEGESSVRNPNQLSTEATIDVGSFAVTVEVRGELSADGETLAVEAEIDTPWMCGRDPVITGTLTKVS